MITGDHDAAAQATGSQLGVDDVRSGQLPADKVTAVENLRHAHGAIAMVGDGVNDAPALAAADVGIVMGAMGSDAALETADIALMTDELSKVPYTIRLSHATLANIRANVAISIGSRPRSWSSRWRAWRRCGWRCGTFTHSSVISAMSAVSSAASLPMALGVPVAVEMQPQPGAGTQVDQRQRARVGLAHEYQCRQDVGASADLVHLVAVPPRTAAATRRPSASAKARAARDGTRRRAGAVADRDAGSKPDSGSGACSR